MYDYERDGAAIYRQSFATIRAEADLTGLPDDVAQVAVRMIHACGQVDLVRDIAFSPGVVTAAREAFDKGPWPRMSLEERITVMRKLSAELAARESEAAALVSAEMGCPITLSTKMQSIGPRMLLDAFLNTIQNRCAFSISCAAAQPCFTSGVPLPGTPIGSSNAWRRFGTLRRPARSNTGPFTATIFLWAACLSIRAGLPIMKPR